uniref:Uncharacterized protein n=1 Tax=Tetraselmis sp. GSL018 TaxID=582737 RepID=A0A061SBF3_9CHLO
MGRGKSGLWHRGGGTRIGELMNESGRCLKRAAPTNWGL